MSAGCTSTKAKPSAGRAPFFADSQQLSRSTSAWCAFYKAKWSAGVKKEEIKVEVEDSRYLIIRTETVVESREPAKSFMKKFRLPCLVDIGGISAGFEDGLLTITVPRSRRFRIYPADLPDRHEILAPAA
ncbi:hypothetical protein IFM89_024995 [Coptis chinensis]|uniref:SHSP domain-containing protein n=1 Tax=Coptis chinensis TaxID=261450 RepID=A0A835HY77_9MAGN|nr:hypothetical protein IFM89_024995 [Coptis chinensis]